MLVRTSEAAADAAGRRQRALCSCRGQKFWRSIWRRCRSATQYQEQQVRSFVQRQCMEARDRELCHHVSGRSQNWRQARASIAFVSDFSPSAYVCLIAAAAASKRFVSRVTLPGFRPFCYCASPFQRSFNLPRFSCIWHYYDCTTSSSGVHL